MEKRKKLKGKVRDYRAGSFLVLCFNSRHGWQREAILREEVDNYLLSVNSPYTFEQAHQTLPLEKRLELLTEAYRSEYITKY